jgi:hypothetical protein
VTLTRRTVASEIRRPVYADEYADAYVDAYADEYAGEYAAKYTGKVLEIRTADMARRRNAARRMARETEPGTSFNVSKKKGGRQPFFR